jgi:hypothetical protein
VVAGPVALDVARVDPGNSPHPVVGRTISIALWIVAFGILAGWLTLAAVHVGDDYRMSHPNGTWVAAAEAARSGALYSPLFDGEHYSGTRFMPLAILLNAFASAVAGDPIVGGKSLATLLMVALLATIIFVLRRVSCPWSLAVALAAAVVATDTGLTAATTVGGDLVPVVLQTGALALAVRGRSSRQLAVAGALAGLAFTSKLTAVWGGAAVITWLAINRQWRPAAVFAVAAAAAAVVTLGGVQLLTHGGLSEHIFAFAFAGVHGGNLLRGPNQLLYHLLGHAYATVVLFPFAVVTALLSAGWRQLSVFHIALIYALLVLMVVFADVGTGSNQLLDVVVLVTLAVGDWIGRASTDTDFRAASALVLIVAIAVVWADSLDLVRTIGFDVRGAVAAARIGSPGRATVAVSRMVGAADDVLAEDASIYVPLRRRPVVMDPFMLLRIDRAHPELVDPLIRRINERRFALVVLVVPLENREFDYWWNDLDLGPRVAAALRQSYRPAGTAGRFFLYRPK